MTPEVTSQSTAEPERLPESHYRDLLANQVDGQTEVRLPFGRADVVTKTHVYEVEPVKSWRHGASQALQYSSQVPQKGALAVYGETFRLREIFAELGRLPQPGLELWWFAGNVFVPLETAADADMYAARHRVREPDNSATAGERTQGTSGPSLTRMACTYVVVARRTCCLDRDGFAALLGDLVNWNVDPGAIGRWEACAVTPPGDVVLACKHLIAKATLISSWPGA